MDHRLGYQVAHDLLICHRVLKFLLGKQLQELHAHVEDGLGRNLQTRCSAALIHATEIVQREMTDRLIPLLCEDQKQQIHNILPKRDFDIAYRLDCRNLCADFKENILFRFSLGPTALMQRWLSPTSARSVMRTATGSVPRPMTPQTPTDEGNKGASENEMMLSFLTKFASLTSRTTVGSIIVIGITCQSTKSFKVPAFSMMQLGIQPIQSCLIELPEGALLDKIELVEFLVASWERLAAKTIGWRVIGVTGTLYGLLYLYERLTWTTKAKERAFKQQYVDYASSKLRLIVDLTSANCSHQVQQELASKFSQLCRHVDQTKQKLVDELKQVDIDITKLQETANRAKMLRNKADFLDGELNNFIKQYLQNNH